MITIKEDYVYYCELYQKAEDIQVALDEVMKYYEYRDYECNMDKEERFAAFNSEDEINEKLDDAKECCGVGDCNEAIDILEELCFTYSFILEV